MVWFGQRNSIFWRLSMSDIHVEGGKAANGWVFEVTVADGQDATRHTVTLRRQDFERLSGGRRTPEELVRWSFEFLLQREPKESILARFDLPVIGRYFPEYERTIGQK